MIPGPQIGHVTHANVHDCLGAEACMKVPGDPEFPATQAMLSFNQPQQTTILGTAGVWVMLTYKNKHVG